MAYKLPWSAHTWYATKDELAIEFARWGVLNWHIDGRAPRDNNEAGAVGLRFVHPSGAEISLVSSTQRSKRDNLRVLVLGIEAMRKNDLRGLGGMMRAAYLQLPPGPADSAAAPATPGARDPWEVLGIPETADLEIAEAVYRAKAKRLHPDAGGSVEAMAELNAAWAAIRARAA